MPQADYPIATDALETVMVPTAQIRIDPWYSSLYPDMTPNEFEALCASMKERGFDPRYALLVAGTGDSKTLILLGGHQRYRAARTLGIATVPVQIVEDSAYTNVKRALQDNMGRRQSLTTDQRKAIARSLLEVFPHWSDRAIAGDANLSPTIIGRLRKELLSTVDSSVDSPWEPDIRIGLDGKYREVLPRKTPPTSAAGQRQLSHDEFEQFRALGERLDPARVNAAYKGLDRDRLRASVDAMVRKLVDLSDRLNA